MRNDPRPVATRVATLLACGLTGLGASAVAAVAADASGTTPGATSTMTTTATGTAATPAGTTTQAGAVLPANVRLRRSGDEEILTDERGFALYTTDEDAQPNESRCVDACAKAWPPLAAPADARPIGEFGVVTRPDGSKQWSYRGKPLYGFAKDEYAGGYFGDGIGNRWRLAFRPLRTPPGLGVMKAPMGRILVNERGQPLFTPAAGSPAAKDGCDTTCLVQWAPLQAPALARAQGDWSTVARPDGTRQWAYRQQPLFAFRADRRSADLKAFEPAHPGWQPIVVQPETPAPSWATLVKTDVGQVFANPNGITLYTFQGDIEKIRRLICDQKCLDAAFTQVAAEADSAPIGDWSVKQTPEGKRVWAYRGSPLYLFAQDKVPGEVLGSQYASGVNIFGNWSPIIRIPY